MCSLCVIDAIGCQRDGYPGIDSGEGAVLEFHRRRIAVFLRRVKEKAHPDLWKVRCNTVLVVHACVLVLACALVLVSIQRH